MNCQVEDTLITQFTALLPAELKARFMVEVAPCQHGSSNLPKINSWLRLELSKTYNEDTIIARSFLDNHSSTEDWIRHFKCDVLPVLIKY